jgi:hypothetical protein
VVFAPWNCFADQSALLKENIDAINHKHHWMFVPALLQIDFQLF